MKPWELALGEMGRTEIMGDSSMGKEWGGKIAQLVNTLGRLSSKQGCESGSLA